MLILEPEDMDSHAGFALKQLLRLGKLPLVFKPQHPHL